MANDVWLQPFLENVRNGATKSEAARRAGISATTIYRRAESDADFAAALDMAEEEAYDMMEQEARRRAFDGVNEPVIYQGELATTTDPDTGKRVPLSVKKYSDSLAKFLLAGYRKKFATNRTEVTGADGGPVDVTDTEREARIATLMARAAERHEQDAEGLV